jgi:uncharacterized protein (DUF1330 family)
LVVALSGIAIGAAGTQILHAQGPVPALLVAEVQVTDAEAYRPYIPKAAHHVAQYGGKYLARGGKSASLEGPKPTGHVAIVQFSSSERKRENGEKCAADPRPVVHRSLGR